MTLGRVGSILPDTSLLSFQLLNPFLAALSAVLRKLNKEIAGTTNYYLLSPNSESFKTQLNAGRAISQPTVPSSALLFRPSSESMTQVAYIRLVPLVPQTD
jgi:hypothetical protein